MKFYATANRIVAPEDVEYPCVALVKDNWDDYGYKTTYYLDYYKQRGVPLFREKVKILKRGDRSTILPESFDNLSSEYCSLGQDLSYYASLAGLGEDNFRYILYALNDAALSQKTEEDFQVVDGFELSLLREGDKVLRGAKSFVLWFDAVLPLLNRFAIRSPLLQDIASHIEALESHRNRMRRYDYFRNPEYGDLERLPDEVKQNIFEAQEGILHVKGFLRSWNVIITNELEDEPLLAANTPNPPINTDLEQPINSQRPLRVFLCHSSDDKPRVRELYQSLREEGFSPWLDEEDILPGQRWENTIAQAVRVSDVIIVCLSQSSINKEGFIQKEITSALDVAEEKPEDTIFIIPLKLEECVLPGRLRQYQYVNYFDERGHERLMRSLRARANDL